VCDEIPGKERGRGRERVVGRKKEREREGGRKRERGREIIISMSSENVLKGTFVRSLVYIFDFDVRIFFF